MWTLSRTAHILTERKALSLKNLGQGGGAPLIASPYLAKTYINPSKNRTIFFLAHALLSTTLRDCKLDT